MFPSAWSTYRPAGRFRLSTSVNTPPLADSGCAVVAVMTVSVLVAVTPVVAASAAAVGNDVIGSVVTALWVSRRRCEGALSAAGISGQSRRLLTVGIWPHRPGPERREVRALLEVPA